MTTVTIVVNGVEYVVTNNGNVGSIEKVISLIESGRNTGRLGTYTWCPKK